MLGMAVGASEFPCRRRAPADMRDVGHGGDGDRV